MANVTELSQWESGIYQLETTDPVEGGAGGISNEQARLLGNRTKWLKDNSLVFLRKGTVTVGDVSVDKIITVSFASIGTANYMVTGSLVSKSTNYSDDNDVFWMVREKTATSFKLCLREVTGETQNLDFDYVIIPF
jgi:hypothetical protein